MRLIIFILCFLPVFSFGQIKLTKNEIDKFTKERRVETNGVIIKEGLGVGLNIRLRSVGDTYFIILKGYGLGAGVIGESDKLIFLLDNDSTLTFTPTGIQSYDISRYGDSYSHQYYILLSDLETLSNHKLKSIRKYTSKGYADIDVPEKRDESVKELCSFFIGQLKKDK